MFMREIVPNLYPDYCPGCPVRIEQINRPVVISARLIGDRAVRVNEVLTTCRRRAGGVVLMSGSKSGEIVRLAQHEGEQDFVESMFSDPIREVPVDCPGFQAQSAATPPQG